MTDPFPALAGFAKLIMDLLKQPREQDIAFFEVLKPTYEKRLHLEDFKLMRILDDVEREDGRIDEAVRDRYVKSRRDGENERDFFRDELGSMIERVEDLDNRKFFIAIALYFIVDEDHAPFDDSYVAMKLDSLLRRLRDRGSVSAGRGAFDTPSARLAKQVKEAANASDVKELQATAIAVLTSRMKYFSDRYVSLRQRYYPN